MNQTNTTQSTSRNIKIRRPQTRLGLGEGMLGSAAVMEFVWKMMLHP
jgi:hypothetical protein